MNSGGVGFLLSAVATLVGCVLADQACTSENLSGFKWTSNGTNTFVTSDPLCLSSNGLLVTRNCSNGVWIPKKPNCAYNQRPTPAVACPSEWKTISSQSSDTLLCGKFELTTAWANTCANYGGVQNTIFDLNANDWSAFIDRYRPTYSDVWLPGKWTGEDTIRWLLPGKMMRSHEVNRTRIRQNPRAGSGCVLMSLENEQYYLSNVDCSEPHAMLCLSTEPAKLLQLACPPGYVANQRNANESWCHAVLPLTSTEFTPAGHILFEMWNMNVLNVPIHLLRNRTGSDAQCAFNPTPDQLTTYYKRSDFDTKFKYALGFVNWRPTTDFSVADNYLVTDASGQWSFAAELTCAIWSQKIDLKLPALNLSFTGDSQRLLLSVTDARFVWQESDDDAGVSCYRSDGSTEVRIDVEREPGPVYDSVVYQLLNLQPGVHRCEAFATKSMEHVKSAAAMVDKYDEFVSSVVVKISREEFLRLVNTVSEPMVMNNVIILRFDPLPGGNNVTFRATVRNIRVFEKNEMQRIQTKFEFIDKWLRTMSTDEARPPVVRSTQLCFNVSRTDEEMTVEWPALLVGNEIAAFGNCSDSSRLRVLAACINTGEFSLATWVFDNTIKCRANVPKLTDNLDLVVDDFQRNATTLQNAVDRVWHLLDDSDDELDSTQLFLINQIMNQTGKQNESALNANAKDQSLNIFDMIMEKPPQRGFQSVNLTGSLLDSFEAAVVTLSDKTSIEKNNYRVITLDPRTNNYSGICLLRSGEVVFLHSNHSIDAIFGLSDLLVATFIPDSVLSQMQRLTKIVFTIIKNDHLYQQPLYAALTLATYIINIQIPNVNTTALPGPIPLFFSVVPVDSSHPNGRYWERTDNNGWTNNNLTEVHEANSIAQFNATYLTSFAMLISEGTTLGRVHQRIIYWISVVGCWLSLLFIALIFLTALFVPKWLHVSSNVILLQLSFAIGMIIVLFLLNVYDVSGVSAVACVSIGAQLHYFVLTIFLWMVVMCYFQFARYIVVFKKFYSSQMLLKVSLSCWIVPLVPVVMIALLSPDSYVRSINAGQQFCYASGYALWLGVIGPVALIGCVNIVIYAWIIFQLAHIKQSNVVNKIKVSVLLFFLLGLPWLFGLLIHWDITRTACYYLFSVSGTLQGFVVGFTCIVLDGDVRSKWARVFGCTESRHARFVTNYEFSQTRM